MVTPTAKPELKLLITKALRERYTSESPQDRTPTGNNYQSILLGDEQTSGFRTLRDELLDLLPFEGSTVLDLGSNLGELSRAARRRGARLVDGFEYDSYFVEIANLVNAYNDVTRVSFFQRDITDKTVYQGEYDFVLGFSVFVYIKPVLQAIRNITKKLFILETHHLNNNLDTLYLNAITPFFPYYRVLGETDWGTSKAPSDKRAVVAFSHHPTHLEGIAINPKPGINVGQLSETRRLDLRKSEFLFLRSFFEKFSLVSPGSLPELLAAIRSTQLSIEDAVLLPDYKLGLSGWVYWFFFLKGYAYYSQRGEITDDNIYLTFIRRYFFDTRFDPKLEPVIQDMGKLRNRIGLRFKALDRLNAGRLWAEEPLRVIDPGASGAKVVLIQVNDEKPFSCAAFDGYHRIFCAKVLDLGEAPFIAAFT